MNKTTTKTTNRRNGAVVVEAAIILPLLIILTIGAIDLAQYINTGQQVVNSSREAARLASKANTKSTSEIQSSIESFLEESNPNVPLEKIKEALTIKVYEVIYDPDDAQGNYELEPVNGTELGDIDSGSGVCVNVDFDFDAVRWISGPSYRVHSTQTIGRRE